MIGDDVVDLADPETAEGAPHSRFDVRVFHEEERERIARATDPRAARWACWAAKEAAYKLACRIDPVLRFAPHRYRVILDVPDRARVEGAGRHFDVSLIREADALQAVARLAGTDGGRVLRAAARLVPGEAPGGAARALALRVLAPQLDASPEELVIEKRGRLPELRRHGEPLPLSLSHHGSFVSFACWLPPRAEAA